MTAKSLRKKIAETESVLLELKEKLKESEKLQVLSNVSDETPLDEIGRLFQNVGINVEIGIRSGGEYSGYGLWLGHNSSGWEIVEDSLNAFVLIPKALREKVDSLIEQ